MKPPPHGPPGGSMRRTLKVLSPRLPPRLRGPSGPRSALLEERPIRSLLPPRLSHAGQERLPAHRRGPAGPLPGQGPGVHGEVPGECGVAGLPRHALGGLVELLGDGRPGVAFGSDAARPPVARRPRRGRRAPRPRVPAHRADQVQPLRQPHLPGVRARAGTACRGGRSRCGSAMRLPSGRPGLPGRRGRRRAAVRGRAHPLPAAHGDLQRHPQPAHGLHRHAVRPQRPLRGDLPAAGR